LLRRIVCFSFCACLVATSVAEAAEPQMHQANGVKIGEVTSNSAIIWTRVTQNPTRNMTGPKPGGRTVDDVPRDADIPGLLHAAPGMVGRVRVRYSTEPDLKSAATTEWFTVSPDDDYTHAFRLDDLQAATEYHFVVDTAEVDADAPPHEPLTGEFKTAPLPDAEVPVRFVVMTCQAYRDVDHPDGFEIYRSMLTPRPDFIVPNGDIVYYDSDEPFARTIALARYHWNRMYGFPRLIEFHRRVPGYWTKDDHDTYDNDSWPASGTAKLGPFTFAEGLKVNREQLPWGDKPYRTVRWGKRLQVWIMEGREFRSPNNTPDGPEKTIWGAEQLRWLKETMAASDADWKVVVSPTPIVGPDRDKKHDNHANSNFRYEGDAVRDFLRDQGTDRVFTICGDRHWQYHSVDPRTGVNEFSAGAASDQHAGGSPGFDKEFHRYHRVKGGYLSIDVTADARTDGGTITFRHRDVKGDVAYEKQFGGK